jgi:23S rRNA (guanosine2251-2'-O)-methyltransferase
MTKNNVIFGIRAIQEAIQSGKSIEKIFMKPGLQGSLYNELFRDIKHQNIPVQRVPVERINHLAAGNHQGVVAIVSPVDYQDLEKIVGAAIEAGGQPMILILDGVTDIRNFGAIARTAECAGVSAIVVPEKGSAPINGDAIKTSAGALYRIPVCRVSKLWYSMKFLKESGFEIIAATEKGETDYRNAGYKGNLALVMGAEDKGISSQVLKMCDTRVSIPIRGEIGSLNVSVAAGILIFEALKAR